VGHLVVKTFRNNSSAGITEIIESRSPAGRNDSVQGWHNLLKKILSKMTPYLREGHLITFRTIEEQERDVFEKLLEKVTVPTSVGAIYMPPSVRFQMMYHRPEGEPQPIPEHSSDDPSDEGVVLACRKANINVVINALLSKPPFAPSIDVYDDGQLLAGYIYNTIDECIGDLTKVLQIHLKTGADRE
jgi:hypothetical protein